MPKPKDAKLSIERIGGVAAFGSAHLKSSGEVAWTELSLDDQAAIDALFKRKPSASRTRTSPEERYLITRGKKSIEVLHSDAPLALRSAVKDEIV